MKSLKQSRREAKALFRACSRNGALDEVAVRAALQNLAQVRPRGYLAILQHLHRLVRLDVARHTAVVESAAPLADDVREQVRNRLDSAYGPGLQISFTQNPALLGGMRVKVGSDVYDGSIQAKLAALEESF